MKIGFLLKLQMVSAGLVLVLVSGGDAMAAGETVKIATGSNEWVEIKDPAELRALFSNKTLKGEGITTPFSFVGHYSADGRGVLISGGQTIPRTWAIKGDEVCITAGKTDCWLFWRHRDDRNEIKAMRVGDEWMFKAKVEDWTPNF